MERFEFPIRILTPIWTAGPSQKPNGLKMSGVMGGMRQCFEMLIRKHGGHTCNITGPAEQRCKYEGDIHDICPACAVFGCTGLQRSFKVLMGDVSTVHVVFPETDRSRPNRNHNNISYTKSGNPATPSIDTWLATVIRGGETINPANHEQAREILNSLKPSYSKNATMQVIGLRKWHSEVPLRELLIYLLAFMSKYSGLGAKIMQGWGQFRLESTLDISFAREQDIFPECISEQNYEHNGLDVSLLNGEDCFSEEYIVNDSRLGFNWPRGEKYDSFFKCGGFGLQYALRRRIKFLEVEPAGSTPASPPCLLPITDSNWRNITHGEPWDRVPWNKSIAFTRALFGQDEAEETKRAGLIGVSHAYSEGHTTKIKFFGCIPQNGYFYRQNEVNLSWDRESVVEFIIRQFRDELTMRRVMEED